MLTIKALGTTTTCTPSNSPKPSLALDVTAAGGGGRGPPHDRRRLRRRELPQTGPADSAIALGTLGGTVLLAGAAGVLWLTRRGGRPDRGAEPVPAPPLAPGRSVDRAAARCAAGRRRAAGGPAAAAPGLGGGARAAATGRTSTWRARPAPCWRTGCP